MTGLATISEAETRELARRLAERLVPGDVVALHGPMGAGKTTFVRGLAEGLGLDSREVSSPTFGLCHEYARETGGGTVLAHLDGYRLASPDELDTIGWDELLEQGRAIVAVEWPERFEGRLPDERVTIDLAHVDEHTRDITITVTAREAHRDDLTARLGELITPPVTPPVTTTARRPAPCPICKRPLPAAPTAAPFCSERCRLVDLGRWFNGEYAIGQSLDADSADPDDDF